MNVKLNGLTLHVEPDCYPPDPRKDYDHLGTMLCWHRHYSFGDQNGYATPKDFYESKEAKNIYVSLPVYMLDHSGTYFPDKETLKAQLNNEVELYNDYMNGAWFAFYIEGKDGEIEDSCGGFFQNGDFADVLKDMKEYTDKDYHSLFDKLAVKYEKQACM